jgi:putative ATPase
MRAAPTPILGGMEGQLFAEEGGDSREAQASSASTQAAVEPDAPLAVRMRPRTLEEVTGQDHLLAPGSALRTAIESGRPHSMILYGPPGTGKTTLARIVANAAGWAFEEESAVNAGRAEVRAVLGRAAERRKGGGRPTVFFLDEIHRFNKGQQDALLPAVEDGLITLIGATTENPYFEVNNALLSRSQIYELQALDAAQIERAVQTVRVSGAPMVDLAVAEDALQRKAVGYDKGGDKHYDYISAWIKATRGSDPDASIYYLAAMLEGGEDPRFIARRMVILASEDVGNADPQALLVATAAAQAVDRVGMPECRINLAQAAVYLSLAPKSNASYKALGNAIGSIRRDGAAEPPPHLQDAHYAGAEKLGRGINYEYSHAAPEGVGNQPLAPESLENERFYEPTDRGWEAKAAQRLREIRQRRT